MNPRRFVALDRDGTLIIEKHYLADPAGVELLPNAIAGLRKMRDLGLGLIVVSNQSGIARGYFTEADLAAVNARVADLLQAEGIALDGFYHCPHEPSDQCDCRKPQPGMMLQAARELHFDPAASFVIGDKACDIDLGRAVHATTLLVRTGYGKTEEAALAANPPDAVVDDLLAAAEVIGQKLQNARSPGN